MAHRTIHRPGRERRNATARQIQVRLCAGYVEIYLDNTPIARHGTDYCKESPTVDEESLHQAIMDAIRATRGSRQQMIPYFIEQLRKTYQEQPTDKLDIGEVENRIEELKASTMALIQNSVLSNTVGENESRLKIMAANLSFTQFVT